MIEEDRRLMIVKLVQAREMGHQGYRWNRAFRREIWRRLERTSGEPATPRIGDADVAYAVPSDQDDGC